MWRGIVRHGNSKVSCATKKVTNMTKILQPTTLKKKKTWIPDTYKSSQDPHRRRRQDNIETSQDPKSKNALEKLTPYPGEENLTL